MTVAGYTTLAAVYEWLIPDPKLTPAGSVAAFADVVESLPPHARVLDCACGTGQLAVGLASAGMDVVASDASAEMVLRTGELAREHGARLQLLQSRWDELSQHLPRSSVEVVFCVGNSLAHAEGAAGRRDALTAMAGLLVPGGRLVLTSRSWEFVRAAGSRVDVGDRLVRRRGLDGVVVYAWQLAAAWEDEHHLEIAVALLEPDSSLRTHSERLSFWPYRSEELVAELQAVGLDVVTNTFGDEIDRFLVVARTA